jgi:peptidoglycan/xylan/chitin deacetylase (PgdA/CDA1 family)/LysM repeat protein
MTRFCVVAAIFTIVVALSPVRAAPESESYVREYQTLLREAGYYRGPIDGVPGPATRSAILSFQKDHGLAADGVVGPATMAALRRTASTYVVRKGDTLSKIAARHAVSVSWLCQVNGIRDPDVIRPGQKLLVRDLKTDTPASNLPSPAGSAGGKPDPKGGSRGLGSAVSSGGQGQCGGEQVRRSQGPGGSGFSGPSVEPAPGGEDPAWQTFLPGTSSPAPSRSGLRGARIALTFNDAPHADTGAILEVLARHGVRATFFLVGDRIAQNRDLVRRMAAEGHELGNHSYSHLVLAGRDPAEVEKDLAAAQAAIAATTGSKPRYFRPPAGAIDRAVAAAAARQGLVTVLWHNVGATDDCPLPPEELAGRIASRCRDGYIVMLHGDRPGTAAVVDRLVTLLTSAGARLVTLSELGGP